MGLRCLVPQRGLKYLSFVYNLSGGAGLPKKSGMVSKTLLDESSYLLSFLAQRDHQ